MSLEVLLAKFESSIVLKRKLQLEFGKQTPIVYCIRDTFERFCETGTVKDRQRSGRPSMITEEKIDEVYEFIQNESQSSVRTVTTACAIPRTTTHRIMTEYLSLEPYKVQSVQQLYQEDQEDIIEMCETLIPMLEDDIQGNIFFRTKLLFIYMN